MTAGCGSTFGGTGLLNTGAARKLTNPGMPYGDYQVCVSDGSKKVVSSTIQNRVAAGTAVQTLTIVTSGSGRALGDVPMIARLQGAVGRARARTAASR